MREARHVLGEWNSFLLSAFAPQCRKSATFFATMHPRANQRRLSQSARLVA
jgi:hypothetical protein